jgi:hypothetical protein
MVRDKSAWARAWSNAAVYARAAHFANKPGRDDVDDARRVLTELPGLAKRRAGAGHPRGYAQEPR